jgi:hypothetical protein
MQWPIRVAYHYSPNRANQYLSLSGLLEDQTPQSVSVDTIFHLSHPSVKSRTRWIEFGQKDSTLYISTVGGLVYISPKEQGLFIIEQSNLRLSIINKGDYTYVSTFSEGLYILKNQQVVRHISTKMD